MKVTHQGATISFCADLTSPTATSIPVAALVVGTTDHMSFAAVAAMVPVAPGGLDPISFDVLSDVPALIKDHVDAVLEMLPKEAPIESILTTLHRRLRNSLHVAAISNDQTVEVPVDGASESQSAEKIAEQMMRLAVEQLHDAATKWSKTQKASRAPGPATPIDRSLEHGLPSRVVWPLHEARGQEARA
jgi:hypothetical protein